MFAWMFVGIQRLVKRVALIRVGSATDSSGTVTSTVPVVKVSEMRLSCLI